MVGDEDGRMFPINTAARRRAHLLLPLLAGGGAVGVTVCVFPLALSHIVCAAAAGRSERVGARGEGLVSW